MSGYTSNCIVCGKQHSTGHIGDEPMRFLTVDGPMVLACPGCVPFAPTHQKVHCKLCGAFAVHILFPEGTWQHDHQSDYTCQTCKSAIDHAKLHERYEQIKPMIDK